MKAAIKAILAIFLLLFFFSACSVEDEEKSKKQDNNLSLGISARDLLSDEKYTSMHLELVYVSGFEPSSSAIQQLKAFLQLHSNKPNGISISKREIPSPGIRSYKNADLLEIEKKERKRFNEADEISVFILFTDGGSAAQKEDGLILGTAYRNTSMVIFEEVIRDLASKSYGVSVNDIESTTLKHEFGHLYGLVGNGSPVQSMHEDSDSKSHCNVSGCLMAASVKFGSSAVALMKTQERISLDAKCLADLKANGGK